MIAAPKEWAPEAWPVWSFLGGHGLHQISGWAKNMKRIVSMRKMAKNQKGTIKRVSAKGEMGRRIREMGLVPNTPVKVQGRAPLMDPVAIKVRDFTLTLRNNEADSIMVEIEELGEETV